MNPKTKRLRGFKLVQQDTDFGYWWYGTTRINIALTTHGKDHWKLAIEFHLIGVEIHIEGKTERQVRGKFNAMVKELKLV